MNLPFHCERCGIQIRQTLILPLGLGFIQDFCPTGQPADIDPDCCEPCGEAIIEACNKYNDRE